MPFKKKKQNWENDYLLESAAKQDEDSPSFNPPASRKHWVFFCKVDLAKHR